MNTLGKINSTVQAGDIIAYHKECDTSIWHEVINRWRHSQYGWFIRIRCKNCNIRYSVRA